MCIHVRQVIAIELYTTLQKEKFSVMQKYFVNHVNFSLNTHGNKRIS